MLDSEADDVTSLAPCGVMATNQYATMYDDISMALSWITDSKSPTVYMCGLASRYQE